ncbi:MAG TPA: hypothetical protein VGN33_12210 [Leifsonia sp.]|jgi:hypothetical protein|nr:hypothetical protein [Leifsonia sp.]
MECPTPDVAMITTSLLECGEAHSCLGGLEVDDWLSAARRVGRNLRLPIFTIITSQNVIAILTDWPREPGEERQFAMRHAWPVEILAPTSASEAVGEKSIALRLRKRS